MKLVIGGATGFVGAETLRQALASEAITSIVTVTRRAVPVPEGGDRSKVQEIILDDFLHYPDSAKPLLADADACIWTIALTPAKAQTYQWEEVKKICAGYALAAFTTMLEARSVEKKLRFVYYSGTGAERDQQRTLFLPFPGYLRMRGQAENDLLKGAAESGGRVDVCVAKPGGILGPAFIGRGPLEAVAKAVGPPLVKVEDCVAATIKQCVEGIEQEPLENSDLQRIGAAYRAKTASG